MTKSTAGKRGSSSDLYRESRIANINELIDSVGNTSDAAAKWDYPRTRLSQLKNGIGSFGNRIARELERRAGVPKGYMDVHPDVRRQQAEAARRAVPRLPVYTWAELTKVIMEPAIKQPEAARTMPCPVQCSDDSFIVINETDAMADNFPVGAHLFVDPGVDAVNGDPVLAKIPGEGMIFRFLRFDGARRYLVAANSAWPERVMEMPIGATIVGVVVFSGMPTRRS